jgi:hypothetical protein
MSRLHRFTQFDACTHLYYCTLPLLNAKPMEVKKDEALKGI